MAGDRERVQASRMRVQHFKAEPIFFIRRLERHRQIPWFNLNIRTDFAKLPAEILCKGDD